MTLIKNNLDSLLKIFIVSFFLITILKLPINFYSVYKNNLTQRMLEFHGFCEKESYGFVSQIYMDEKFKNVNTHNFGNFSQNSLVWFYDLKKNFQNDKIIILNYDKNNQDHKKYLENNYPNYNISVNYRDKCFLMEKNIND